MSDWKCMLCEATLAGSEVRRSRAYLDLCTWCADELARTHRGYCRRCKSAQPLDQFKPSKPLYCRACRRAQAGAQRDVKNAARRAAYAADEERRNRHRAESAQWRAANYERERAKRQRRYQERRSVYLARQREYDMRHRERRLEYMRKMQPVFHARRRLRQAQRMLAILRGGL